MSEDRNYRFESTDVAAVAENVVEYLNAIEHSPTGGGVAVTIESDRVTIRDEGPGIPDADLPRLFTRFWRGSARQAEGTGLGLR